MNTVSSEIEAAPRVSKASRRTGVVLSAVPVLFLILDGLGKVVLAGPVKEACEALDIPLRVVPGLGVVLIAATVIYAVPRTAVLGAILLTGYLGGAIWTHVRMGDPIFPIVFPALVGAMLWGGLVLRDPRLRAILPLR